MVARLNGVQEAAGSTPVTRTTVRRPSAFVGGLLLCPDICGFTGQRIRQSPIIYYKTKLSDRICWTGYSTNIIWGYVIRRWDIVNTEIMVAIVGALVAVLTAVITNYLTKRSQLKFEERKLKEEYYTNYVKAISNNVLMKDEDGELDDAQNRLILVGSAEVVRILMQFHDAIKESAQPISGEEHDKILTNLIKAMRADLYGTKKINDDYPTVHLSGLRPYGEKQ